MFRIDQRCDQFTIYVTLTYIKVYIGCRAVCVAAHAVLVEYSQQTTFYMRDPECITLIAKANFCMYNSTYESEMMGRQRKWKKEEKRMFAIDRMRSIKSNSIWNAEREPWAGKITVRCFTSYYLLRSLTKTQKSYRCDIQPATHNSSLIPNIPVNPTKFYVSISI